MLRHKFFARDPDSEYKVVWQRFAAKGFYLIWFTHSW